MTVDPHKVRQESMIAMLERERRSLTSSFLALALLAVAFAFFPNKLTMYALLTLRLASFAFTRRAASALENAVRQRRESAWPQRTMIIAMALTGVTLGLMLLPPPADTPFAAVQMVRAVVLIAVALIAVTLAAMRGPRDAMLASFFVTTCSLSLVEPQLANPAIWLVAAIICLGIRTYASSTGHHIVAAAKVLVEKRQLSEDLSIALARAEYLGSRDPLTGLGNRRKLFEQRETGCADESRHVLMIDLDRFKTINDDFGHSVGDRVLVAAADIIRERLAQAGSSDDLAFRLGGEEFLVILNQDDGAAARVFAEDLRSEIADIRSREKGLEGATISASIGIARWRPGEEFDDVLQRSDAACYKAKNTGRNRVRAAA
jgi:diguanylate cyclase (GGDEF)-like protein